MVQVLLQPAQSVSDTFLEENQFEVAAQLDAEAVKDWQRRGLDKDKRHMDDS